MMASDVHDKPVNPEWRRLFTVTRLKPEAHALFADALPGNRNAVKKE